jgi:PAS domain S-box-containing protein
MNLALIVLVIKAFETGQSQEIEKQLFKNKYWHLRAYPIKDENNNILGVVEIGLDITERVEREARFLSIFKAAPFGIGLAVNREIQEVNDAICEMTGYKREELIKQSGMMLYPTQEDYDYVGTEKYRQIDEKGKGTVETRWKKKDGSIINIILSSSPIDTKDLSKGVTFTAIDITKSKETEKELRKLLDEKNILVKEVHHRIKNNMSTIAGFLSLQTRFISDESIKTILMDARSRIIGMMSIYDKLYRSSNFDKLSVRTYLLDLINGIETI